MEPTQKAEVQPTKNKKAKIIIIVLILLALIGTLFMLQTKTEAPVTNGEQMMNQNDSKELNNDIDSATTFNNEASLNEIDKEF